MQFPFPATIPVAHRGAHDGARAENSLEAVRYALALGAPAVEFDVCPLRDGTLVISHDAWIEVSGVRFPLPNLAPDDPRVVAAALPPVDAHLEAMAESSAMLVFDWKGWAWEEQAAAAIREHGLAARTIFSTSNVDSLRSAAAAEPELTIGLTLPIGRALPAGTDIADRARRAGAAVIMLDRRYASPERAAEVRRAGLGLFIWTAYKLDVYRDLLELKPDGIMTSDIAGVLAAPASALGPARESLTSSLRRLLFGRRSERPP
jgi:glycerophosphoryl diester phosphodiesterase